MQSRTSPTSPKTDSILAALESSTDFALTRLAADAALHAKKAETQRETAQKLEKVSPQAAGPMRRLVKQHLDAKAYAEQVSTELRRLLEQARLEVEQLKSMATDAIESSETNARELEQLRQAHGALLAVNTELRSLMEIDKTMYKESMTLLQQMTDELNTVACDNERKNQELEKLNAELETVKSMGADAIASKQKAKEADELLISELTNLLEQSKHEVEQLRRRVQNEATLSAENDFIHQELSRNTAELEELDVEIERKTQEITKLKAELEKASLMSKARKAEHDRVIAELRQQLADVKGQLETTSELQKIANQAAQQAHATLFTEKEILREDAMELEAIVLQARQELQRKDVLISALEHRVDVVTVERENAATALRVHDNQRQFLVESLEAANAREDGLAAELLLERENAATALRVHDEQTQFLVESLQTANAREDGLAADLLLAQENATTALREHLDQIQYLEESLQRANAREDAHVAELDALNAAAVESAAQRGDLIAENEGLKLETLGLEHYKAWSEDKIQDLECQLREEKAQQRKLKKELKALQRGAAKSPDSVAVEPPVSSSAEHTFFSKAKADSKINVYAKVKREGETKLPVLAAINFEKDELTETEVEQFISKTGLNVTSPSGQLYALSCVDGTPKAVLPHTDGIDADKYKLAVTIINMIDNILSKGMVVKVNTTDPFVAEIAKLYVDFLQTKVPAVVIESSEIHAIEGLSPEAKDLAVASATSIFELEEIKLALAKITDTPWYEAAIALRAPKTMPTPL